MKILSPFIHPKVVPKLNVFLSSVGKKKKVKVGKVGENIMEFQKYPSYKIS